jgi:hypothetical protein
LEAQAKEQSTKLFDETITFLNDKLKAMGRTKNDAVTALVELMNEQEKQEFTGRWKPQPTISAAVAEKKARKPRDPNAAAKPVRAYVDLDSEGKRPEVGKTYVLNGTAWLKGAKGASKKDFVDAVKHGATWAQLLKPAA